MHSLCRPADLELAGAVWLTQTVLGASTVPAHRICTVADLDIDTPELDRLVHLGLLERSFAHPELVPVSWGGRVFETRGPRYAVTATAIEQLKALTADAA